MTRRTEQTEERLLRDLALALSRVDTNGPLVTITRVSVTPDLKTAHVWVANWNTLTDAKQRRTLQAFRQQLALRATNRSLPHLILKHDESSEYAAHIQQLLNEN